MSNTMSDTTMTRPIWATETIEPKVIEGDCGYHTTTVVVGDFGVLLNQYIHADGTSEPVRANLEEFSLSQREMFDGDAQGCRDLAAALLKAATIIDDADAATA